MTLITDALRKLRTLKNMVRSMPKMSCFRGSVEKQHGKCTQTWFKIEGDLLYHIYWSLGRKLSYKKSLLVIYKISRMFPSVLRADGKNSLLDRDNFTQRIQMLLSGKQKTFSGLFCSFLRSSSNLEHFEKKDNPHSWCVS